MCSERIVEKQNTAFKKLFLLLFVFVCAGSWGQNNAHDSLWKVYNNKSNADTSRLNALHAVVRSYVYNQPDSAIIFAEQELKLARLTKQTKYEGKALNSMGVAFFYKNESVKAMSMYAKALALREQINDVDGTIQTRNNIARIYSDQGNSYKVLEFWLKELKKLEDAAKNNVDNRKEIVDCLVQIAGTYREQDENDQAFENFQRALSIVSTTKDTAAEIGVIHQLARTYGERHEVAKSVACYNKAKAFYQSKKDFGMVRGVYNHLGLMYKENNDNANALLNYKRSLALTDSMLMVANISDQEKRGNKSWQRAITGNIAEIYLKKGDFTSAIEFFSRSLKAAKETQDSTQLPWVFYKMAGLYQQQGNYKTAKYYADLAVSISKNVGRISPELRDMELVASGIDSALGNGTEAYLHYKQYILLRDKFKSEEVTKAATREKHQKEFEAEKAIAKAEQDKKDTLAAEEKRKQNIITWSVAGGLLLVVVFAGFVLYSLKLTRKQKETIEVQKTEVENAKLIIEERNKDITDSITYAKRIQTALIANTSLLNEHLPQHFVLFKPKDIVAGDFYWAAATAEGFLYITADCTGHGVPGAFMSLLNISKLTEIVNQKKITRPDLVLNMVRDEIIAALNPQGSKEESKDGMDAVLCKIDFRNMKLEYATANNSFYIVRNKELLVCKADKMPVGKGHDNTPFTLNEIALEPGDMIFTFTDGYADQFGGPKGKKFKYKQLEEVLLSIAELRMDQQKEILNQKIEEWKGELEQVDDVCIIGVRV